MKTFRINHVAKVTGISKEVLRVWEKRYRLLSPERGTNRYRLYSEMDVELLLFLRKEMEQGQSIGELASLGKDGILTLIKQSKINQQTSVTKGQILEELERYLLDFDATLFEKRLNDLRILMPFEEFFHKILVPLQMRVGELWTNDKIDISIEHYVTAQAQQKISTAMSSITADNKGPKVIIACPSWDLHEIGAQILAYYCSVWKCRVIYLGANLPLESLINFSSINKPDIILLSCTTNISESMARIYFERLISEMSSICPIWAGGQGTTDSIYFTNQKNIKVVDTLNHLENLLIDLTSGN
jgi:MerR family transcriptional regulator, light-induced transcriptional regulator